MARRSVLILLAMSGMAACGETIKSPANERRGHTFLSTYPLPAVRDHRSDLVFVLIPAGEFTMGGAQRDERPRHRVRLSEPFWLAVTEVTSAQWQHFAQNHGESVLPLPLKDDSTPANVSHDDAIAYCKHYGYQLPTEAQWEWACRAGDDSVPSTINIESIARTAWYHHNAGLHPMPVATRAANAFGLHDMLGNVWEWCADPYNPVYSAPQLSVDPRGPATGARRVLRGGSWFSLPPAMPWTRGCELPSVRNSYFGFRPACAESTFPR